MANTPGAEGSDAGATAARLALPDDWPAQATDTIVKVVGTVRDRTTGPAVTVARAVVYGLLAGILGVVALVLVVAALVRLVDVLVPDEVWAAHLIVGVVFTLAGVFLWSKRSPRRA